MISLLLPYWDRQQAADEAMASLDRAYRGLAGLEVLVIDDGNEVPYVTPETGLDVRVIRMPLKRRPLSPVTCWNIGAREARGDILVLSCIEVLHPRPVLEQMAAALELGGPETYVVAAAWCPEKGRFQCHSTVPLPFCPPGTGMSFCSAIYREKYLALGGFDEDFRHGAGWEDKDFINRLVAAGMKFVMRDDLVVTHPKTGAKVRWDMGAFLRNQRKFMDRWGAAYGSR